LFLLQFDLELIARADLERHQLKADNKKLEATVTAQVTALTKKDQDIVTLKGQITLGKRTYLPAIFC
jgi:hypothetical protein